MTRNDLRSAFVQVLADNAEVDDDGCHFIGAYHFVTVADKLVAAVPPGFEQSQRYDMIPDALVELKKTIAGMKEMLSKGRQKTPTTENSQWERPMTVKEVPQADIDRLEQTRQDLWELIHKNCPNSSPP